MDILSGKELHAALEGCTHVVNCTRGDNDVMHTGLKNMLKESKAAGVQRFVHISSVAVYGDPPPPEARNESRPARPDKGSYGDTKLRQDRMISAAYRGGLSCANLCPPNISGAYSGFVGNVLSAMRAGSLGLVDRGETACNVVDVENLAHAIRLALSAESVDGERIFITDGPGVTWKRLTDELAELAERAAPLPPISREQAEALRPRAAQQSLNPLRSIKHLVSSDVREALRKDPLLARVDRFMRGSVAVLLRSLEDKVRLSVEGPLKVTKAPSRDPLTSVYNLQQLRGVEHSIERAKQVLGYEPLHSFEHSMAVYRRWFKRMRGFGAWDWKLSAQLEERVARYS